MAHGNLQRHLKELSDFLENIAEFIKENGVHYVVFKNGTRQPASTFQHNSHIREIVQRGTARLDQIERSRLAAEGKF